MASPGLHWRAAALFACTLLMCGAVAAAPCDKASHFVVPSVAECALECSSRGAVRGPGWSGEPATYQGSAGDMCCRCNFIRVAETYKVVLQLEGASFPVDIKQQNTVQNVLLKLVNEFWTWRGAQPLSVDSMDMGEQSDDGEADTDPGRRRLQRRRRDLLQGPVDANQSDERWWPDALETPLPASTADGVLVYIDTAIKASEEDAAEASLREASSSGSLTAALQDAGVTVTNATVLYAGAADPDIAVLLGLSTTTDSSAPSEADSSTADTEAGADTESDASGGADSSQSSGGDSSSSSSILIIAVSVTAGVLVAVTAGVAVCMRRRRKQASYSRWEPASSGSARDHEALQTFQRWQDTRHAEQPSNAGGIALR